MTRQDPIAIIGIGCRFPGNGNTPSSLWDVLRDPQDLLTPIPEDRFKMEGYYHENGEFHGHTNVKSSYFLEGKGTHRKFDAQFFGISPTEAHALDPQVRLLLETVYEAMEDSGHTLDQLQGSDTAVYSGVLMHDYEHIMSRDVQFMNRYHATGITQSLIANRVSYCFNWRGPSMILDTACSASLYAVHLAVQQLRSGASALAVATGCNLILDPLPYVSQSKMNMLSPTSRSRMWDAGANGYARGEGVAAIILKPLSQARADGDPIHAIIRETGTNQDGRTPGITMPSSKAQIALIRDCYARANLDLDKESDRPQYFEAHGTGTPAGDPIEAEAISATFFSNAENEAFGPLHVGGIKTVIGHTEGTAGLAGIIKAILAMKHKVIPANLLFDGLNPRIEPFIKNLRVPTSALEWPTIPEDQPRRASVNSFGFGGANAHAILETYASTEQHSPETTVFSPFIFSAASQASLDGYLDSFRSYLETKGSKLNLRDLAFTLHSRRTRFPFAASFSAPSTQVLASKISQKIESARANLDDVLGVRAAQLSDGSPRILGIFTGQGAQWARMGAEIITNSPAARKIIASLDASLASLPSDARPLWTLQEELLNDPATSRINEPTFAQTLTLAIQILLTDILAEVGIRFNAIVGHSSGEIAAAYAAGRLSAADAIRMSYHRGLSVSTQMGETPGKMMAVGSSQEDIQQLLDEPEFKDRAWVAAVNSSSSITISGDADAIDEIYDVLRDENKFARHLKANRAYHSPRIIGSSQHYMKYQDTMRVKVQPPTQSSWFSSVTGENNCRLQDELKGPYWIQNLLNPVLFKQAVETAWNQDGPFDIAIEIGPHNTLRGPSLEIIQDLTNKKIPYTSLLKRGMDSVESLADALGYISCHLGKGVVDLKAVDTFLSGDATFQVLQDLPPYSWNHTTDYWHESRYTKAISHRSDKVHELLGHLTPDSSDREMRWRHSISAKEVPWLSGHRVQDQTVYPGAAFIVTVVEACLKLAKERPIQLIEVLDITMGKALTFDDDESQIEVVFSLSDIKTKSYPSRITGVFNCSAAKARSDTVLDSLAHGKFCILLGAPSETALPGGSSRPSSLLDVNSEDFYSSLDNLSYEFSGPFIALSGLKRKMGLSTGFLPGVNAPTMLIHPAMLDAMFQSIVLAASCPSDGRMWTAHIPNHIDAIRVNPFLCEAQRQSTKRPAFEASCEQHTDMSFVLGHSNLFAEGSENSMIAVEGVNLVALSRATADNDRVAFSSTSTGPASPDISKIHIDDKKIAGQYEFTRLIQRAAYFHLRNLQETVPLDHPSRREGPYTPIFNYASHTLNIYRDGHLAMWNPDWEFDTPQIIDNLLVDKPSTLDIQLLQAVGPRLADIVMGNATPIAIGMENHLLARYYKEAFGMSESLERLAKTVGQIVHRYPRIRCLEVGAGTGTATKAVLDENGFPFSEYTFTDISSGFFPAAQEILGKYREGMTFKPLDISEDPVSQGFQPHSYDLIIASLVLHATPNLSKTLKNVRSLLKPGGYLIAIEIQKDIPAHIGAIFGAFTGWWLGADDNRLLSPCISVPDWDNLLHQTGFSGCDSSAYEADPMVHAATIFISQAVDDRVSFLRNPLANPPSSREKMPKVVILGAESFDNVSRVSELDALLQPFFANVVHCPHLGDVGAQSIDTETLVLSLVDLEKPFFQETTTTDWESMKALLQQAGSLVWVTQGRTAEKPYTNMMVGLVRSVLNELPGLKCQFLDFESENHLEAKKLAVTVLQFVKAIKLMQNDNFEDILQTIEPELIFQKDGSVVIPRMRMEQAMNDRYNASRRMVSASIPLARACIDLGPAKAGYYVRQDRTFDNAEENNIATVRVSSSLLTPLRLNNNASLFWSVGERTDTLDLVLCLSLSNKAVVKPEFLVPLPAIPDNNTARFLRIVSLYHISTLILTDLEEGDRVLVHDADPIIQEFLKTQGLAKGFEVICTTTCDRVTDDPTELHPNSPKRTICALDLDSIRAFVDFGVTGESKRVSDNIIRHLNILCKRESAESIFTRFTKTVSERTAEGVQKHLKCAGAFATASMSSLQYPQSNIIGLEDVNTIQNEVAHKYIVSWEAEAKVPALIEPSDTHPLFSKKKTYWLVGLSGSLGRSLCEWMISKGARYLVISSRKPKIEPAWLKMLASRGAIVDVRSCDVTDMHDLEQTYESISLAMPPIGGVAQGAMVLHDIGLPSMSLDHLQKVLRPKVEGSINLDLIFREKDLEFFIFFSSVTSVVGTPGQAAYSAANLFMASLAEQRRQRGLSSVVINIGPVLGAGYIMRTVRDIKPLLLLGLRPLCERDFHLLFAEAVSSCKSRSSRPIDITMGIKQIRENEDLKPKWISNPIMSHWILNSENVDVAISKSKVSLKDHLHAARNEEQVSSVVKGAILDKLIALLRLDLDINNFDDTVAMDELGVDSLMATEVRLLLVNAFRVNVPVLRIMSGITFKELVNIVVSGLDNSMVPNARMDSIANSSAISTENRIMVESASSHPSSTGDDILDEESGESLSSLEASDREGRGDKAVSNLIE